MIIVNEILQQQQKPEIRVKRRGKKHHIEIQNDTV